MMALETRYALQDEGPVVMVDDNKMETRLAAHCFARAQLSNPWIEFSDGLDFLDYLISVKNGSEPMPALVLIDVNMPRMSGFEVLERARSDPFFKSLPIFIMLTNSPHRKDVQRAKEVGARGFQRKPHSIEEYVTFFESLTDANQCHLV